MVGRLSVKLRFICTLPSLSFVVNEGEKHQFLERHLIRFSLFVVSDRCSCYMSFKLPHTRPLRAR